MGDPLTCILIELVWLPFAAIALLITLFFFLRSRVEEDPLQKYLVQRKIKYPLTLLLIILLLAPVWIYLTEEILPFGCDMGISPVTKAYTINEFSDGSTEKNISFPSSGGYNSETVISIPKKAVVTDFSLVMEHPGDKEWRDDFFNLSLISENQGFGLDEGGDILKIKTKTLEVNSSIDLSGTHFFDEVTIKEGNRIIVPPGEMLELIVKGTMEIGKNAGITADGRPYLEDPGDMTKDEGNRGDFGSGGGGGGYGGEGGYGGDDGTMKGGKGGQPFGLDFNPRDVGMSGGRGGGTKAESGSGIPGAGGFGGGLIKIEANRLILDGYLTANGGEGEPSTPTDGTGGGGGGSGGSIYISANDLDFNGRIMADGGMGGDDRQTTNERSDGAGGGGGGGRILIMYSQKTGYGLVSADGGKGGSSNDPQKKGGDGTEGSIRWISNKSSSVGLIHINLTSVDIKPDNLRHWAVFSAKSIVPAGCDLEYSIMNAETGGVLCRIKPKDAEAGYDITGCAKNASRIKLNAEAVMLSFIRTPEIDYWGVSYVTELRGLEMDLGIDQEIEYIDQGFNGELILTDNSTKTLISGGINKITEDCSCRGCAPDLENCSIAVRFRSRSSGDLTLKNLSISYSA